MRSSVQHQQHLTVRESARIHKVECPNDTTLHQIQQDIKGLGETGHRVRDVDQFVVVVDFKKQVALVPLFRDRHPDAAVERGGRVLGLDSQTGQHRLDLHEHIRDTLGKYLNGQSFKHCVAYIVGPFKVATVSFGKPNRVVVATEIFTFGVPA